MGGSFCHAAAQVGVAVGVTPIVAVGVAVGVAPPIVPMSRNIWSGAAGSPTQVVLTPQVRQPTPKPPPGFCQAAGLLACTVRSVQPHWPAGAASCRACTETQYVPGVSTAGAPSVIWKTPALLTYGWAIAVYTFVPGRLPLFA